MYSCVTCHKTYAKPLLLAQHERTHTGDRPFKCTQCDKLFLRKSHLQAHLVSHQSSEEKPYHCSICGKGVNTPQHLKRHEITHTKSFKCHYEGCLESFYKHQSLRHHILSVHEKTLTCKVCQKTFTRPSKLAQHNLKYHGETPIYQCDFKGCYKNFKTWSALQLHVKSDHPKLKCGICGKYCVGGPGLRNHMLIHPGNLTTQLTETSSVEDDQSAVSMTSKDSVRSANLLHDDLSHKLLVDLLLNNFNTKQIKCEKCGRFFARKHDLQRHLRWHRAKKQKVEEFLRGLDTGEGEYSDGEYSEESNELSETEEENGENGNEEENGGENGENTGEDTGEETGEEKEETNN